MASAQFLSLSLEAMDQKIMVVDADERVILSNQHACKLTGVPARFLAARPSVERVFSYQSDAGEFGDLDAAAMARMRS